MKLHWLHTDTVLVLNGMVHGTIAVLMGKNWPWEGLKCVEDKQQTRPRWKGWKAMLTWQSKLAIKPPFVKNVFPVHCPHPFQPCQGELLNHYESHLISPQNCELRLRNLQNCKTSWHSSDFVQGLSERVMLLSIQTTISLLDYLSLEASSMLLTLKEAVQ